MEIIEETYRQITLWCRPNLKRSTYSFSETRRARLSTASSSTIILREMRQRERRVLEESGLLDSKAAPKILDEVFEEYTSALSTTSESFLAFEEREAAKEISEAPQSFHSLQGNEDIEMLLDSLPDKKPRLKRLRSRISNAVFDYSEIEQEKIEQKIDQLVNADGYYNEVEPVDIDVDYRPERRINKPVIIAVLALIAYIFIILKF